MKRWTVGNEVYGSWEYDLHPIPHDPTTYANEVATGYYPKIKAADPNAQVGVVVGGTAYSSWDSIVLKKAKYDFVEYHYYAQGPGAENDAQLLGAGVSTFASTLRALRAEMTSLGVPTSIPIYVGELNTVYTNPGKQTVSIVNGLFAAQAVGEMMKQSGVNAATWWLGYGGCDTHRKQRVFGLRLAEFRNVHALLGRRRRVRIERRRRNALPRRSRLRAALAIRSRRLDHA